MNHLYYVGRPLDSLLPEIQADIDAMTRLHQNQTKLFTLTFLLLVKKLLGLTVEKSENQDFDTLEGIQKYAVETGNKSIRANAIMARLELSLIFQKWGDATKLLAEAGDLRSCLTGRYDMTRFTAIEVLISIQAAKDETSLLKKRTWKKKAVKSMKMIRGWVKMGNGNLVHTLHLLEAELAVLQGKNEKAEENFKAAITVASRNGFIQDRAFSSEMASEYYRGRGDDYWRNYHMENAIKCYSEWGASSKLEELAARGVSG